MNGYERVLILDEPLGYGPTDCTECGRHGERRLPARFPHICHTCLFPPPRPDDPAAEAPDFLPVARLIEELQQMNLSIGAIYNKGERRIF